LSASSFAQFQFSEEQQKAIKQLSDSITAMTDKLNSPEKDEDFMKYIENAKEEILKNKDLFTQGDRRTETQTFQNIKDISINNTYGNINVGISTDSKKVILVTEYIHKSGVQAVSNTTVSGKSLNIKASKTSGKSKINYYLTVPKDLKYKLQADYCNVSIEQADIVNFNGNYTNIKLPEANQASLNGDYNNVSIGNVKEVSTNGSTDYNNFKINTIDVFNIDSKFSNITINNLLNSIAGNYEYTNIKADLAPSLKAIVLNGAYSSMKFKLPEDLSLSFDVELKYGKIRTNGEGINLRYTEQKGKEPYEIIRKGTIGTKAPTANVKITNKYADVVFSK
jgi:hypothetical protein